MGFLRSRQRSAPPQAGGSRWVRCAACSGQFLLAAVHEAPQAQCTKCGEWVTLGEWKRESRRVRRLGSGTPRSRRPTRVSRAMTMRFVWLAAAVLAVGVLVWASFEYSRRNDVVDVRGE